MSAQKTLFLVLILLAVMGGTLLSGARSELARANSYPTPTLYPSAWNYLPIIRGELVGPTITPRPPWPTRTPYFTVTPSPTPTATPTSEPWLLAEQILKPNNLIFQAK